MFTKFVSKSPNAKLPPVVIIFGWVGANMKHVSKYAEMLTDAGVEHVWATIAPRSSVFWFHRRDMPALAAHTLAKLQTEAPGKPAVIYCFSNGGAMVYQYLWRQLSEDEGSAREGRAVAGGRGTDHNEASESSALRGTAGRKYPDVRIAGSMFDSAPADLSVHTGARAIVDSVPSAWQRQVGYWLAVFALPLMVACFFPGGLRAHDFYVRNLLADTLPAPQLFLYSETDSITSSTFLRGFIQQRRQTHALGGQAVHELYIAKEQGHSPHVGHMRSHPSKYRDAVREFLEGAQAQCLVPRP